MERPAAAYSKGKLTSAIEDFSALSFPGQES
ncbi:conserved protein of unknown function [Pseudomonas marincola]|uniref:Uncharacterized protein n=1 Tax=Pseudomonas marincola TaxID=437900 RepID=A0A653E9V4_9PSED|nr:conserved protein of unknown function [Pseudomonas marincola]